MDQRDHLQRMNDTYGHLHPDDLNNPHNHVIWLLEAHLLVRRVIENRPQDARSIQLETIADGLGALARSLGSEVQ